MALTRKHSNSPPPVRYNIDSTNHRATGQKPTSQDRRSSISDPAGGLPGLFSRETLATTQAADADRSPNSCTWRRLIGATPCIVGDTAFVKRIVIVGSIASGKSTLARALGEKLGREVVELDELWWQPGSYQRTAVTAKTKTMEREQWRHLNQKLGGDETWIIDGSLDLLAIASLAPTR